MSDEGTISAAAEPEAPTVESLQAEVANLKKRLGEQGNEIGEARKLKAEIEQLRSQAGQPIPDESAAPARTDNERLAQIEQQQIDALLSQDHPDWRQQVGSTGFQEWVQESPMRSAAWAAADAAGNVYVANEMLSQYKKESGNDIALAKAQVMNTDNSKAAPKAGRFVFSQSELDHMALYDKPRYQALLPQIKDAYHRGLVGP